MKKILFLAFLFTSILTNGQSNKKNIQKGSVSGKIIDKNTNTSLPYVNIIIKDIAKKIITGGITDDAGVFKVKNIPVGNNILEIQFIGLKLLANPL